jgi:hypothetical protein
MSNKLSRKAHAAFSGATSAEEIEAVELWCRDTTGARPRPMGKDSGGASASRRWSCNQVIDTSAKDSPRYMAMGSFCLALNLSVLPRKTCSAHRGAGAGPSLLSASSVLIADLRRESARRSYRSSRTNSGVKSWRSAAIFSGPSNDWRSRKGRNSGGSANPAFVSAFLALLR